MPRKPLIIDIIAISYLVSPVFILLQAALLNQCPFFGSAGLFAKLLPTDIIVLILYLVCAVAVYSVKKWGWYTFIFSSLYLIVYNIIVFIIKPHTNLTLLILYNCIITLVTAFFFRKTIIAPYFTPRLRWWETEPRYRINIFIEILSENKTYKGEILDISHSGCFINPTIDLTLDNRYIAKIHCLAHTVIVKVKVIRKATIKENYQGFGVMFINLTQSEKEGIHHIVKELEKIRLKKEKRENTTDTRQVKGTAARYEINHSVLLKKENSEIQGRLWDISSKGCFITLSHAIQLDVMHEIEIQCMNISVKARGIAKWETNFINGKNALRDETYSKIASSERVLSSENDFSADKNFLDNSDRNKEFTDETPDNSASKEILSPENSAPKQGIRFHGVTSGEYGGYGFQFVGLSKPEQESIKAMIGALKKAGAKERLKQTSPLAYELIEQDLLNSPYKIVLFLKKSLFNRTK